MAGLRRLASLVFGGAVSLRRQAYNRGLLAVRRVPVPVISIGGITIGGSGKTPVAAEVARLLLNRGIKVGVVTGGYGGRARHKPTLVPLDGTSGLCRDFGDETALLAGWLAKSAGASLAAGKDKAGAAALAAAQGAQVVVVDDGFSHLRLHRDLDILVLDPEEPLMPLPLGRAREPAAACAFADLIWHHSRQGRAPSSSANASVSSQYVPTQLKGADGRVLGKASSLRGKRVFLVAGIARPGAFLEMVRGLGAQVVGQTFIRDHWPFSPAMLRQAADLQPDYLLCTEKDLVRMSGDPCARHLVALTCSVQIIAGSSLLLRTLERTVP